MPLMHASGLCSVLRCAQSRAVLPALCCAAQLKDWAADPGAREPDLGGVALGRQAPMPVTAAMENQAGGASVQSIIDTGECGPHISRGRTLTEERRLRLKRGRQAALCLVLLAELRGLMERSAL